MAWFTINSKITIESTVVPTFSFSGVHEIRISKNMHTLMQRAVITVPGVSYFKPKGGGEPVKDITSKQFAEGDKITIELGYDGKLREEFKGFVRRKSKGEECIIECEGYERLLRLKVAVTADYTKKETTAKKLLEMACAGTGITVECPVDFPMSGMTLNKANGEQVVRYIQEASDNAIGIFFKEPTVLWCGLIYTAYATRNTDANVFGLPAVAYRMGYNVPKNNGLNERVPKEEVQIIFHNKLATGKHIFTESGMKSAARKVTKLMNHVPDEKALAGFAQEKQYKMNYSGFEGKLTAFLQPYAQPGYDAYIDDRNYPELKGTYVVEGVHVSFGLKGGWRVLDIGPRVGFDN